MLPRTLRPDDTHPEDRSSSLIVHLLLALRTVRSVVTRVLTGRVTSDLYGLGEGKSELGENAPVNVDTPSRVTPRTRVGSPDLIHIPSTYLNPSFVSFTLHLAMYHVPSVASRLLPLTQTSLNAPRILVLPLYPISLPL